MDKKTKEKIMQDTNLSTYTLKKLQEVFAENMAAEIENRKAYDWGCPFGGNIVELSGYSVLNLKNCFDYVAYNLTTPFGAAYLIDDVIYYDRYE